MQRMCTPTVSYLCYVSSINKAEYLAKCSILINT
jgi:hypothetical protein